MPATVQVQTEKQAAVPPGNLAGSTYPALLLIAVLIAFLPVLQHPFLPWDDYENITRNPNLQPANGAGLLQIWTAPYDGLYSPLPYTTWWLERLLGAGPATSHGINLLLHAGAAWIVYCMLVAIGQVLKWRYRLEAAFAGALLFALHPLQVEPVAWATGRKDLLAGILSLASAWQYARWREHGSRSWYLLALLLFAVALFAKPSVVAVPVILIIFDLFIFRQGVARSVAASLPFLVLSLVWAAVTASVQHGTDESLIGLSTPEVDVRDRIAVVGDSLLFYAWKFLWPVDLSPVYDRTVKDAITILGWMAAATLLVLAGLLLGFRWPWAAGIAVFFAALMPVSGLVPFHYQAIATVADRYTYLSLFGAGLTAAALAQRSRLVISFVIVLAMMAGGLSYLQAGRWNSSLALWSHAVKVAPGSGIVRNNLGLSYGESGRTAEAQEHLEAAVKVKPDFAMAHNNLGALYLQRGREAEAVRHYEHAVRLAPNLPTAHSALLAFYFQQGKQREAAESARVVLRHDPNDYQALAVLASVLGNEGKIEEALNLLREAAARAPGDDDLQSLLKAAEEIAKQ